MTERTVKLLHVFPSFAIGGQQRRLARLADAFGDAFSHRVISLDGETGALALFGGKKIEVEALVLRKSGFFSVENVRRLQRAIAASHADLLCTYNFGAIEAAIANRLGPNLPHVHHEDGFGADEADGRQKATRVIARRFLLSNAQVVTPSSTLEKIALKVWKLPRARVTRIPVGVDLAAFSPRAMRDERPVVVGALGALRAEKNLARLIRCFETASAGTAARLVIFGAGPEGVALKRLAADSGARERIEFPGETNDAAAALAGVDIFALSSDTEQMPTSLIEAMAAGLPFVATNVGDVVEMATEAQREFIVETGDEAGFGAALQRLISGPALRARLGAANRRRSVDFEAANMTKSFRRLYLESIEAGR